MEQRDEVVLRGMGNAIARVVNVAEIVKRRVPGLHQMVEIGTTVVEESHAEEGAEPRSRNVSNILITLSLKEPQEKLPGYQAPLSIDEVGEEQSRLVERRPPRSALPAVGGAASAAGAGAVPGVAGGRAGGRNRGNGSGSGSGKRRGRGGARRRGGPGAGGRNGRGGEDTSADAQD